MCVVSHHDTFCLQEWLRSWVHSPPILDYLANLKTFQIVHFIKYSDEIDRELLEIQIYHHSGSR